MEISILYESSNFKGANPLLLRNKTLQYSIFWKDTGTRTGTSYWYPMLYMFQNSHTYSYLHILFWQRWCTNWPSLSQRWSRSSRRSRAWPSPEETTTRLRMWSRSPCPCSVATCLSGGSRVPITSSLKMATTWPRSPLTRWTPCWGMSWNWSETTWGPGTPPGWTGSPVSEQINPLVLKEFLQQLLSGSMILLRITLELRIILQNIWRRVGGTN